MTSSTLSIDKVVSGLLGWLSSVASFLAQPVLRIALALPFLRSGLTRWDGFLSLSPGTLYLFQEQFKLHIFGGLYGFPGLIYFSVKKITPINRLVNSGASTPLSLGGSWPWFLLGNLDTASC